MIHHLRQIVILVVVLTLAGCGGLASEPAIVRTQAIPTITPTAPPDVGYPVARIDLARGAQIFGDEKTGCAACHGIDGKGNGPVASQFACPITDFTSADVNRSKTIGAWFGIVSNGNNVDQTCLMPPWKGRFNEPDRWDATSYVYSLHYGSDMLAQGQSIWGQKCAACHTQTGKTPEAGTSAAPPPNFSDPAVLIKRSDTDLEKAVQGHSGGVGKDLSDDQRWAVVAYMRSLSWDHTTTAIAQATPAATTPGPTAVAVADSPTITVSGKLINGTTGKVLPAGQALTLRVIEQTTQGFRDVNTVKATTAADGAFSFGELQRQNGLIYVVLTDYAGTVQSGGPVQLQSGSGPKLDLSFNVYEITNDPSIIHVELERVFVDFTGPTTALVQAGIRFRNVGDRLYISKTKSSNGDPIAVQWNLPDGAQNVQISQDTSARFFFKDNLIQTTLPIAPTQTASVQFSYVLPFGGTLDINAPIPYEVDALEVELPQLGGATIQDSRFTRTSPITLQNGIYDTYALQKAISAGTQAGYRIVLPQQKANEQRNVLALVLLAAMLLLLGTVGAIWILNRRSAEIPKPPITPSDAVLQAIVDLDTRFEAGQIERSTYDSERARLKADLLKMLG